VLHLKTLKIKDLTVKKTPCKPCKAFPDSTPANRALHRLATCWGGIDLASIELLATIEAHPGVNIKTAAEICGMDHRAAQMKIALLSTGLRQGRSSARGFVTDERNPYDRRERQLDLTPAGAEFLEDLRRAL